MRFVMRKGAVLVLALLLCAVPAAAAPADGATSPTWMDQVVERVVQLFGSLWGDTPATGAAEIVLDGDDPLSTTDGGEDPGAGSGGTTTNGGGSGGDSGGDAGPDVDPLG